MWLSKVLGYMFEHRVLDRPSNVSVYNIKYNKITMYFAFNVLQIILTYSQDKCIVVIVLLLLLLIIYYPLAQI